MLSPQTLTQLIQAHLTDAYVELQDLTGSGDHWQAVIVSEAFAGKSRVQRHQLVYQALQSVLATNELHALTMKTLTPAEWKALAQPSR
ncbi:MAG: BolA/IbaG family iron-sulfur metabolism protein [Gloeomargarita sp. SKYBB_i_bin120]|nr:BolA/IbaG family iron-sulfur metabolism protein [Gloeomargarita sp. SKYG98]MCS7291523.1 BolA/IbaG family iron-sulfur metabolism protein [Gloeomargarita sp. SKYB120]MDW8177083.1 BolA/IbaG family iron-sulfur metabolism protein [Gloeomargarita sp. SKYBB_i_bin120]